MIERSRVDERPGAARAAHQLSRLSSGRLQQEADRVRLHGERLTGLSRKTSRRLIEQEEAIRANRIAAADSAAERRLIVGVVIATGALLAVGLRLILTSGQLPPLF
ncbi:hypothetical protein C5C56_11970 [Rathayibacter sp. AY1D1]|uniref:hypothetical protein n=1 Tax=unclassified Rathayibacter TaxID=2609250 RepID=UPI000CE75663|nr:MULTISPECIES: hypothetical protein [unclassified Rathayibacter]PPG55559.1 hypothetical protein C5C57_17135 [Rathayibacter sp. AY1C5]PPH97856.1 hypothetical protein C5C56_11970 [Rathayibacter sp. AY1D1]